jgi:hypothetical protein
MYSKTFDVISWVEVLECQCIFNKHKKKYKNRWCLSIYIYYYTEMKTLSRFGHHEVGLRVSVALKAV